MISKWSIKGIFVSREKKNFLSDPRFHCRQYGYTVTPISQSDRQCIYPSITQTVSTWSIKGIFVSRDEYFFGRSFYLELMVLTIFGRLFEKETKNKVFLHASMKSFTNCETPSISSKPLQRACYDFLIATCVSKRCSESRLWSWKLFRRPARNVHFTLHWKKSTNESEAKPEQKFATVLRNNFYD